MSYYESSIIYLALKFITCYGKNDQSGINIFFFKRYDAQLFYVIIYISISNEYSKNISYRIKQLDYEKAKSFTKV